MFRVKGLGFRAARAGGLEPGAGLEGCRAGRLEGPLSQCLAPTFKHPDLRRLFVLPPWAPAFGRPP